MGPQHNHQFVSTSEIMYRPDTPFRQAFADYGVDWNYLPNPQKTSAVIGNDVWVGQDVILGPGITLGDGCVVAAGAIVTKDVAPYAIVGGVPAKLIKYRFKDEIVDQLLKLKWWDYAIPEMTELPFDAPEAFIDAMRDKIAGGGMKPLEPIGKLLDVLQGLSDLPVKAVTRADPESETQPEAIRLVIWDLDETFWKGTLTEGGIRQYVQENHDIVVELARRGIISSICSRNDLEPVKAVLEQSGLWDYFVFPSIDWEPKGPRLRSLIETAQLRAPTVLFIDDNPMNLSEAEHFCPGIRTATPDIIDGLLDDPLCAGKADLALTRLRHYKLLETKKVDKDAAQDNLAFLRKSGIRIEIEYDVDAHIDRAIELVNRTNQLNFTKYRLPENEDDARRELRSLISLHWVVAGLVRVRDNYGDYGLCGFYTVSRTLTDHHFLHFCFSCRTLGMGVEAFVFDMLGRPSLHVVGDVLTDVRASQRPDWIVLDNAGQAAADGAERKLVGSLHISGGCDLSPMLHYLAPLCDRVLDRLNVVYADREIRLEHSSLVARALRPLDEAALAAFTSVGYAPEHLNPAFFQASPNSVWILSFWADGYEWVFRHKATGELVPVSMNMDEAALGKGPWADVYPALMSDFENLREISKEQFSNNLRQILDAIPDDALVFLVMLNERDSKMDAVTECLNEVAQAPDAFGPKRITIMRITDFTDEVHPWHQFDRMVYYRLSQAILAEIKKASTARGTGV